MPIFEYHCQGCRKTFERLMKVAIQEVPCPQCGALAQRAVSAPAAVGEAACAAPSGSGFR